MYRILFTAICLLELIPMTTANGQLKYCSKVYCLLEEDTGNPQSVVLPQSRRTHARAGKRGPARPPGTANYTRIDENLRVKYEELEEKITELQKSLYQKDCNDICQEISWGEKENEPIGFATTGSTAWVFPEGVKVYCDCSSGREGGAWTVFQRRMDGSQDFYQNWQSYVNGFGSKTGEFWLGLDALSKLASNPNEFELRIDLMDWENEKSFAEYSSFSIGDSSTNYTLTVAGYSGNAGDSLIGSRSDRVHNQMAFSTKDMENDRSSNTDCAEYWHGAWWFNACFSSHLNGKYYRGGETRDDWHGIIWDDWKGYSYSLKAAEMKFRKKK